MVDFFVYGTLLLPEVMQVVVGRVPPSEQATLGGHVRSCLYNACYPAVVPGRGLVQGRLYEGLRAAEVSRLDAYEGSEYRRARALGRLADGRCRPGHVYLLRAPFWHRLTGEPWDAEEFRTLHASRFLQGL